MANPILSGISQYVDETREELLTKVILGGKSISMFNLMSGIKGSTALHYLDSTIVLDDATSCGFDPKGTDVISQRIVTPVYLKINKEWCEKNLLNSYAAHRLKTAATGKVLPYETEFLDQVSKNIQNALEDLVWKGDSANANEFDGILKIAENDGADVINKAKGTSIYAALKEGYLKAKEEVVSQGDFTIFMSDGLFRNFVQELVALNYYHITGVDTPMEITLPGTSVKVVAVHGLNGGKNGNDYIVFARTSNIYYATDLMNDSETFDFWYSADSRVFRLAAEWFSGVQIAFPDECVIVKIAQ